MRTVFDLCQPRDDVLKGRMKDEEFAADLTSVVRPKGKKIKEYADPAMFFRYTYPTQGLKTLLEAVCRRLSGKGGELNSVIRLDTQYGGGKTHSFIALVHAVQGMKGVANVKEFVDPKLLPEGKVRVAALDGENADPANGLGLKGKLKAYSIWGEMAYRLAGKKGFERVRKSDETHVAPGAETIAELFGDEPTLILIDEVSVYLRKVARVFPDAANQFTAFMHALIKAVSSTPKVALVMTLAIGAKDQEASDAVLGPSAMSKSVAVIVAHPDDETLWAGGTILMHPEWDWMVVALCRRSDPDRAPKFSRALLQLGAHGRMADLDDGPDQWPLPNAEVREAVLSALPEASYDMIMTHGPGGEYTRHLRHEETSRAVVALWEAGRIKASKLWMFAYEDGGGQYLPRAAKKASIRITLPQRVWQRKHEIIEKVYGFTPDSFEARATPREEAFLSSGSPADAEGRLEEMGEGP